MILKKIVSQNALNPSQIEVLNTLFMTDEVFTGINKFVKGNDQRILEIIKEGSDEQLHTTDKFDLQSKKSAAQKKNQPGQGLKILTPNQMLSRLPISLAQLKTGNNSEKLKNEIRQLLYSFYRSKNLQKISTKVWLTLFKTWKQFL